MSKCGTGALVSAGDDNWNVGRAIAVTWNQCLEKLFKKIRLANIDEKIYKTIICLANIVKEKTIGQFYARQKIDFRSKNSAVTYQASDDQTPFAQWTGHHQPLLFEIVRYLDHPF